MLCLYVQAPFAACRTFTAGWYRPTATFLTPTAAYGLLLNLAGIDSRLREGEAGHDGKTPASLTRPGLPPVRLALGVPNFRLEGKDTFRPVEEPFPRVQTIFQQLHNYPVGKDAGTAPELARGNKNNISPVRREFLSDLRVLLLVEQLEATADLEGRVLAGVRSASGVGRYGLPFLGDNQYLPDRIDLLAWPLADTAHVSWYQRVEDTDAGPRPRTTRLTTWIERADLSRTRSALFAPGESTPGSRPPPEGAWTRIEPPPETPRPGARGKSS